MVVSRETRSLSSPCDISFSAFCAKAMADRSCVSGCTAGWAHPQILTRHHAATTHRTIDTCFSLTCPEAQRLNAVGRLANYHLQPRSRRCDSCGDGVLWPL